jgi:hypothetical protein
MLVGIVFLFVAVYIAVVGVSHYLQQLATIGAVIVNLVGSVVFVLIGLWLLSIIPRPKKDIDSIGGRDQNPLDDKENFDVEDIEPYEKALAKIENKRWNIEDAINTALPNRIMDFIVLSIVGTPIVLVFWLVIKAPPLAIGAAIFFSCLLALNLYYSSAQIIKWNKVKDIVLPELQRKTAVHFRNISVSVTDNYLVTWSGKNVHIFELCDVTALDGKKAMQNYNSTRNTADWLLLKRNRKIPKIVGTIVDFTEIDKANKLVAERKQNA